MKYGVSLDAYEINLSDEELSRAPLFEGDEEFDWGYRDDVIGEPQFLPYAALLRRLPPAVRRDVRFTPSSGHQATPLRRLLL